MDKIELINSAVDEYKSKKHIFERFRKGVVDFFSLDPTLNEYGTSVIHSIKSRLKDAEHLRDKIDRKWNEETPISKENIFSKITDLAGVRVLHLYQDQFPRIHNQIMKNVESGDWHLHEPPVVYSWDPEATEFFKQLDLTTKVKPSYYTSIHYLVKPREDSEIICEIQVRTLFEEIWGEIDHQINYPHPTDSKACQEQLRVLSKLVSTGTRLADSIYRTKDA